MFSIRTVTAISISRTRESCANECLSESTAKATQSKAICLPILSHQLTNWASDRCRAQAKSPGSMLFSITLPHWQITQLLLGVVYSLAKVKKYQVLVNLLRIIVQPCFGITCLGKYWFVKAIILQTINIIILQHSERKFKLKEFFVQFAFIKWKIDIILPFKKTGFIPS